MPARLKPAEFDQLFGGGKPKRERRQNRKGAYANLLPSDWPVERGDGFICATLPEPPSANNYYRNMVIRIDGCDSARTLLSVQARDYRNAVSALLATTPHLNGELRFTYTWFRSRRTGDLDNRQKQLIDALQAACVFVNDSQIVEIHGYRRDDKSRPRVEIEIREIGSRFFE